MAHPFARCWRRVGHSFLASLQLRLDLNGSFDPRGVMPTAAPPPIFGPLYQAAPHRVVQVRQTTVASEGDEVRLARLLLSFESERHAERVPPGERKDPHLLRKCGAPQFTPDLSHLPKQQLTYFFVFLSR